MPRIGFGTWQLDKGRCAAAVRAAIEAGYRHVDTAQVYGNEREVGEGIASSAVPRDELVIATKVWITSLGPDKVIASTNESLRKLGLDRVDILYVHWPARFAYKGAKTLRAFSKLVDEGKVTHVGVSNFTPRLVDEAIAACDKPIFANQVEHHPLLQQRALRTYLASKGIHLVAYSPLGRGKALDLEPVRSIATKHGATPAQVVLAWEMAHGAVPIPKATSKQRIEENLGALDVHLDVEDIARIDGINTETRLVNPPGLRPRW